MQTPAEHSLIAHVDAALRRAGSVVPRILDIGAGQSLVIEGYLQATGRNFVCDRLDTEPCRAEAPYIGECIQASIESAPMIPSGRYEAVFANYVLEHVHDIPAAAREIKRILKPGGIFAVSTPNPQAPEFILSRFTPLWLHQKIRGSRPEHRAFETVYAYRSINELADIFRNEGLNARVIEYYPATETYLYRFPFIRPLSRLYDTIIRSLGWKRLLGNVCVVFNT